MNLKRILLSAGTAVFMGALIAGGTGAFFSDSETSTGNVFAAGDIDLQIDNESYAVDYNIPGYDDPTGEFVVSTSTSWTMRDLTVEKFFNFIDLKPGDIGEDTISVHVGSNDAYVCAAARITSDLDNSITEPEDESDLDDDNADATTDGDLDEQVNFAFWVDDGDNVYEPVAGQSGVAETIFLSGPLSGLGTTIGQITLADASSSVLADDGPIPGGETFYIGKAWCFGDMESSGLVQDGSASGTPLTLGTGFTCDGSDVGNAAQTDSVTGDLQFYAEQARNNGQFQCQSWEPEWPDDEIDEVVAPIDQGGL